MCDFIYLFILDMFYHDWSNQSRCGMSGGRYHSELEWEQQYGNYTRLMRYMNRRQDWKVNIRFGTLSDFFQLSDPQRNPQLASLLRARNTDIETLSGDFFPYSDRNDEYWTGFYSTRPFDKRFQREVSGSQLRRGERCVKNDER